MKKYQGAFTKDKQLYKIKLIKSEQKKLIADCKLLWAEIVKAKVGYKCEFYGCNRAYPQYQIHAHHFLTKGAHSGLRFDVENGMSLCVCHHRTGKDSAHAGHDFRGKILGKVKGYKAIRSKQWETKLLLKAGSSYRVDYTLEYLYLLDLAKGLKDKLKPAIVKKFKL